MSGAVILSNSVYPLISLHKVATPVERSESPVPGNTYRQIGVKLWGEGAYERESIDGSQTQYKTLSRVEENDIIVNKIWARNGSVTVVSQNLSGCYGSNEFPTFVPIQEELEPRWFYWITKTSFFWEQCDAKSRGTSGQNRIRPEKFLEIEIPLPRIDEQRRIVGRIEELVAKVEEARGLRSQVERECDALCRSLIFGSNDITMVSMSELVKLREPDITVQADSIYHFAGVYSFGRGVFIGNRLSGMDFSYKILTQLKTGNFVYPKLMAWEGALGVVPPECNGLYVSPEFPVFEVDESSVLPEVLDVYFRTPSIWPNLAGISTGTNVRRRRLHPSNFLQFKIPLPSMKVQGKLREVKSKIDQIKGIQAQTSTELDALLPSILDKAFKGEL